MYLISDAENESFNDAMLKSIMNEYDASRFKSFVNDLMPEESQIKPVMQDNQDLEILSSVSIWPEVRKLFCASLTGRGHMVLTRIFGDRMRAGDIIVKDGD